MGSIHDADSLLLPAGTRLVHIGPHKTGTTSLQAAFWAARAAVQAQGVRYAGRSRHSSRAVRAVTEQLSAYSEDAPPPIREWHALAREIRAAREPRLLVSSEFFAWATPDIVRRVVNDLGPAGVHVAVTLRPLGRVIPSMWQQNVQTGSVVPFDRWLDRLLADAAGTPRMPFWTLHHHDRLIERWADVVGIDHVTAVVVDDRDHSATLRAFEALLGLRTGTLAAVRDLTNRSLTLAEAEAVRAFNIAFRAELHDKALHAKVMRLGAAQYLKRRRPGPDEARIALPEAAVTRVLEIASTIVDGIRASGVRVVGDLEVLREVPVPATPVPAGPATPASAGPVVVPPEVAARLAIGVLVATGAAHGTADRDGGAEAGPGVDLVPTHQLSSVIAMRAWEGVTDRVERGGRLLGAVRERVAERVAR